MSDVVWKKIKQWERYEVSNHGQVRNMLTRLILKPLVSTGGYEQLYLYGSDGSHIYVSIHRLVAAAFVINRAQKPHVNHIDGNKTNNAAGNLEWCTPTENMRHAKAIGTHRVCGEENARSKLISDDVRNIRSLLERGYTQRECAAEFKVSASTINRIATGKGWPHV